MPVGVGVEEIGPSHRAFYFDDTGALTTGQKCRKSSEINDWIQLPNKWAFYESCNFLSDHGTMQSTPHCTAVDHKKYMKPSWLLAKKAVLH